MASSVNKVILVGNLGADRAPRSAAAAGGQFAARDGRSIERPRAPPGADEYRVVSSTESRQIRQAICHKGARSIGPSGGRKWQDQSGQDKYSTEVVLRRFRGELQLLDRREGGGGGVATAAAGEMRPPAQPAAAAPRTSRPASATTSTTTSPSEGPRAGEQQRPQRAPTSALSRGGPGRRARRDLMRLSL